MRKKRVSLIITLKISKNQVHSNFKNKVLLLLRKKNNLNRFLLNKMLPFLLLKRLL
jgi:hypothetical protein